MKDVKEFVIDRKIWGTGTEGGYLLRVETNKLCCIGIYLRACGVEDKDLKTLGGAHELPTELHKDLPIWMSNVDEKSGCQCYCSCNYSVYGHTADYCRSGSCKCDSQIYSCTEVLGELYEVNDAEKISEGIREQAIKEKFASVGIQVTFEGTRDEDTKKDS